MDRWLAGVGDRRRRAARRDAVRAGGTGEMLAGGGINDLVGLAGGWVVRRGFRACPIMYGLAQPRNLFFLQPMADLGFCPQNK